MKEYTIKKKIEMIKVTRDNAEKNKLLPCDISLYAILTLLSNDKNKVSSTDEELAELVGLLSDIFFNGAMYDIGLKYPRLEKDIRQKINEAII